jgi:hypothetical protein
MRRAGFLALALMISWQPCCSAGGKTSQHGPLGKTNFVTADNGLGFVAMEHLTQYLTKVAIHVAGMDPPAEWEAYPTSAEMFPDWLDEPVARPGSILALGQARCAENDFDRLAAGLKEDPSAAASLQHRDGLIRVESPRVSPTPSPAAEAGGNGLDIRSIYSSGCIIPAG